jgi:hypothetical protein
MEKCSITPHRGEVHPFADPTFLPSTPEPLGANVIPMRKRRIFGNFWLSIAGLLFPLWLVATPPVSKQDPDNSAGDAPGEAVMRLGNNAYISAGNLQYGPMRAEASDGICYGDDTLMLVGEALRGSPGDNTFVVRDIRLTNGLFCGRAKSALHTEKAGKRRIVLRHGEVYFGEPGPYTPSIFSERIIIDDMDYMRFRGATLKIGNHGIFYVPYYSTPARRAPFEARISYGRQEKLGFFGKHQFLFPAGPHARYGFAADFYTRRGILIGPALDLTHPTLQARFRGGFIHDGHASLSGTSDSAIGKSRNFVKLRYNQTIRSNFNLCGEFSHMSDDWVLRDFRRREFLRDQFPDNFLEASYTWQNNVASVLTRVDADDNQRTVERLPQLRYERITTRLPHARAYYSGFCELAHLKLQQDGLPSVVRAEAYYGLDLPLKWQNFLTFKPLIGNRATLYHPLGEGADQLQNRLQIGCDLRMNFFGDWDVSLPKWELYDIRHRITPIFQYRHTWQRKRECPVPFDMEIPNSVLPPIDLGERRDVDDNLATHVLRLGIENLFQSVKNKTHRHTFAELSFFEDLRFRNPRDGRRWSDFYTTLSLLPGDFLSMQLSSQIDLMRLIINDLHTCFSIHDAMLWRLSLSHNFFRDDSNQYGLHLHYRLNCSNLVECLWRYDVRARRLIQQHYKFRRRINNAWCWDADFAIRSKTPHADRWQISVGVSFLT